MNVKVVCLVCRIQIKNVQNPYRKVAGYKGYSCTTYGESSIPSLGIERPKLGISVRRFGIDVCKLGIEFMEDYELLPFSSVCTMRSAVRPSQRSGRVVCFHSPCSSLSSEAERAKEFSPTSSLVPMRQVSGCSA